MINWLKKLYWRFQQPLYDVVANDEKVRMEVMSSPLWDEHYYLQHYNKDVKRYDMQPLDHFLQIGWKEGYNPSELFDCTSYNQRCTSYQRLYFKKNGNPLVHFLFWGRFHSLCGYSSNVYPASQETIERYLEYKSKRTSKSVVYTCITNDYDDLSAISSHYYVDPDWDYVCFSDNSQLIAQKQLGIWEIRPLAFDKLDNTRNNRYHKILPHKLFPEYDQSVYLDANINILTPYLFNEIKKRNEFFLAPFMLEYKCLYQSAQWMLDRQIDKPQLEKQLDYYRQQGFPENYGMFENNLLYRKHNLPEVQNLMEHWWKWVSEYCRRDQSSLAFVFWDAHLPIERFSIHNVWADYNNYCIFPHVKPREY